MCELCNIKLGNKKFEITDIMVVCNCFVRLIKKAIKLKMHVLRLLKDDIVSVK